MNFFRFLHVNKLVNLKTKNATLQHTLLAITNLMIVKILKITICDFFIIHFKDICLKSEPIAGILTNNFINYINIKIPNGA